MDRRPQEVRDAEAIIRQAVRQVRILPIQPINKWNELQREKKVQQEVQEYIWQSTIHKKYRGDYLKGLRHLMAVQSTASEDSIDRLAHLSMIQFSPTRVMDNESMEEIQLGATVLPPMVPWNGLEKLSGSISNCDSKMHNIMVNQHFRKINIRDRKYPLNTMTILTAFPELQSRSLVSFGAGQFAQWNAGHRLQKLQAILHLYGQRFRTLKMEYIYPLKLENMPVMSRLEHLDIGFNTQTCCEKFQDELWPKLNVSSLVTLSVRLHVPETFQVIGALFMYLEGMVNLRKLSITVQYDDEQWIMNNHQFLSRLTQDIMRQASMCQKLPSIEVFRVGCHFQIDILDYFNMSSNKFNIPDYRTFLDALSHQVGPSIKKFTLEVPQKLFPELFLKLNFATHKLVRLETLVLIYHNRFDDGTWVRTDSTSKLIDDQNRSNQCASLRNLTLKNLYLLNKDILHNIEQLFPKLTQLNVDAAKAQTYHSLVDAELAQMITTLKHLRVLRFEDAFPKHQGLAQSIVTMCTRAVQVKSETKAPLVIRVPLYGDNREKFLTNSWTLEFFKHFSPPKELQII